MYLSMLSNEEKHLFLELELYMAKIDGDFSQAERDIIDAHCIEMHIDNNNYECEYPLDIVLSRLTQRCNYTIKHIIFLELTATVLADEVYHDSEKTMMNKLAGVLDISESDIKEAYDLIVDMKNLYNKCADYIKEV